MNLRVVLFAALALTFAACTERKPSCECCDSKIGQVEQLDEESIYRINSTLHVEFTDKMEWILRYDSSDVEELRQRAADEQKNCDVLFFGSSSIRLWKSLKEDMAPLKVVNRGYGGAMLRDLHYNYHTVLADYNPKAFVLYCDNDLAAMERDLQPTELFDLYRLLVERLERDYPGREIFILSIKFNECRAVKREEHRLFNAIMADYAKHKEGVTFVDVNTPLLKEDGSVDNGYFEEDLLHVNREGYKVWSSVLKPMLEEYLAE